MTTEQAIALGVLQGLGEFLPISSSGHLILVPWLLGYVRTRDYRPFVYHRFAFAAVVALALLVG